MLRHFGGDNRFSLSINEINRLQGAVPQLLNGALVVADDVFGGIYAVNRALPGFDPETVIYMPPDAFVWLNTKMSHSEFLHWSMYANIGRVYWQFTRNLMPVEVPFHKTICYLPPLWAEEASESSNYTLVDTSLSLKVRSEIMNQLDAAR